jgi:hypothetical protein
VLLYYSHSNDNIEFKTRFSLNRVYFKTNNVSVSSIGIRIYIYIYIKYRIIARKNFFKSNNNSIGIILLYYAHRCRSSREKRFREILNI